MTASAKYAYYVLLIEECTNIRVEEAFSCFSPLASTEEAFRIVKMIRQVLHTHFHRIMFQRRF